jgi:hypothetical protein
MHSASSKPGKRARRFSVHNFEKTKDRSCGDCVKRGLIRRVHLRIDIFRERADIGKESQCEAKR